MNKSDLAGELWREYEFGGRIYRIENPQHLYCRNGGTTHRVIGEDGVVHCVPAPGHCGCVLRWMPRDASHPIQF